MPHAGRIKQLLKPLKIEDLKAVQQEFCPRIKEYDGDKTALVDRLRGSLYRSIEENNELSYQELMEFILSRRESGKTDVRTQIKEAIENMEITGKGSKTTKGINENYLSAEVFQVLHYALRDKPYRVIREEYKGGDRPDFIIRHTRNNSEYVIEVKRASNKQMMEALPNRLSKYRKNLGNVKRVYALVIVEREKDLPGKNSDVRHSIQKSEEEPKTEVSPEDLRYELR